jgi:hypothetical protein
VTPSKLPPRHFWPSATFPVAGGRFPCGKPVGTGPFLITNDPPSVTCRTCAGTILVQGLLREGRMAVLFNARELRAWGLLR